MPHFEGNPSYFDQTKMERMIITARICGMALAGGIMVATAFVAGVIHG